MDIIWAIRELCRGEHGFEDMFDKAKSILDKIESECIGCDKLENIYLTRKADIYRREAETERDYLKRFELLKQASEFILKAKK